MGQPIVDITLTESGAKQFTEVTQLNLHKRLAIVIDGKIVQAPIIQTPITGGKMQISGSFTKAEVNDLARKISEASKAR